MTRGEKWASVALGWSVAYALVRLYWAAGGRWGYSACGTAPDPAELATGCGANAVADLSLLEGWGAVAGCVSVVVVAVLMWRGASRWGVAAGWATAAVLAVAAFPLHLLFQVPAAFAGRPTDWLDLSNRLALVAGAVVFAGASIASTRRCRHRRPDGPRPVPRALRGWAYAALVVVVVGWMVPHVLWLSGVPFGIASEKLEGLTADASSFATALVPIVGGLLGLGLAHRWGQVFPGWVPLLRGREVPWLLAAIPAGAVSLSLTAYGVISIGFLVGDLAEGMPWTRVVEDWAPVASLLVFVAWGVTLGMATVGYARLRRPRCETCRGRSLQREVTQ